MGVVSTNYMAPMKILNPTSTPITIHKGKPVGEFQILDGESQIHNTEPGKNPQVCHIVVLMPVFSPMTRKSRVMLNFCPISTNQKDYSMVEIHIISKVAFSHLITCY